MTSPPPIMDNKHSEWLLSPPAQKSGLPQVVVL